MADKPLELKMNRVLVDSATPPKPINKIQWTRVSDSIVMEVGYFDLPELRHASNAAKEAAAEGQEPPATVNLFITDRFTVTPSAAIQLKEDLDGLVADLRKNKMIPPEEGDG